jgi:hypothetical protein
MDPGTLTKIESNAENLIFEGETVQLHKIENIIVHQRNQLIDTVSKGCYHPSTDQIIFSSSDSDTIQQMSYFDIYLVEPENKPIFIPGFTLALTLLGVSTINSEGTSMQRDIGWIPIIFAVPAFLMESISYSQYELEKDGLLQLPCIENFN